MSSMVFYCNNCGKSFASEDYGSGERPRCPQCDKHMISTGYSKDDWLALSKEKREALQRELAKTSQPKEVPEEQAESRNEGSGIVAFADQYLGFVGVIRGFLVAILVLGLLILIMGAGEGEGMIIAALSIIGGALDLLLNLCLACWFYKSAVLKGHQESVYFWTPFLLTVIGYLLVISLPDRGKKTEN